MELFIPGLCLFLVAIGISFLIIPRFTPLVIAVLSLVVLVVAVREHYKMFADEYRLSTWQESLKVYAPAIMIIVMILFLMYSILAFFTNGSVPIPSLPEIPAASPDSTVNQITQSLNKVANSIGNTSSNVVSNVVSKVNGAMNQIGENISQNNEKNNKNKNKSNISRSFLETL